MPCLIEALTPDRIPVDFLQALLNARAKAAMVFKSVMLFCCMFLSSANVLAQEGPFLRISLGPGVMTEYSTLHESGLTIAAKNHAIGWGFDNSYAVSFSEFGAFVRNDVGEKYRYINLDAYGIGAAFRTEGNINFHAVGGYGTVHFSDSWAGQGDFIEDGYAVAFGVDKRWLLSSRIDLGVGPLVFFLNTPNYTFTDISLNFWFNVYLFPQQ